MFVPWSGEEPIGVSYTECIVTFLDILGFRHLVDQSISQPETRDGILHSLQEINAAVADTSIFHVDESDAALEPFKIHSFSDLIVRFRPLSDTTNHNFAIFREVLDLCYAQARLLEHGTLVRGGMTVGKLYFDDQYVFGPGLVRAYELENRLAIYPRIVMERGIAQDFSKYWGGSELIQQDADGTPFISYLTASTFSLFDKVNISAVERAHRVLTWSLEETAAQVASERQKLIWASTKFNEMIDHLALHQTQSREQLVGYKIVPEDHVKMIDERGL